MDRKTLNKNELCLVRELFIGKRWRMAKALFFVSLKAAPVWFVPIVTARIIDLGYKDNPSIKLLLVYAAVAILLFLQNIPAAIFYMSNLVHVTRGIGRDLRIKICRQLQVLSLYYHSRNSVGKLHSKSIRDIEILELLPRMAIEQGYNFFLGQCK